MQKITKTELEILKVLWDKPLSIKELASKLNKNFNTVKTLVYRLINKNIIIAKKEEKGCVYICNISKDKFVKQATKTFLEFFYDNDAKRLIEDIKELKRL